MRDVQNNRSTLQLMVPGFARRHLLAFGSAAFAASVGAMVLALLFPSGGDGIARALLTVVAVIGALALPASPLFRPGSSGDSNALLNQRALASAYIVVAALLVAGAVALPFLPRFTVASPSAPFFLPLVIALSALPVLCRELIGRR